MWLAVCLTVSFSVWLVVFVLLCRGVFVYGWRLSFWLGVWISCKLAIVIFLCLGAVISLWLTVDISLIGCPFSLWVAMPLCPCLGVSVSFFTVETGD